MFCRDHPEAAALDSARRTAGRTFRTRREANSQLYQRRGERRRHGGRYPPEVAMSAQIRGPASSSLST
jgi:hypothetical protein